MEVISKINSNELTLERQYQVLGYTEKGVAIRTDKGEVKMISKDNFTLNPELYSIKYEGRSKVRYIMKVLNNRNLREGDILCEEDVINEILLRSGVKDHGNVKENVCRALRKLVKSGCLERLYGNKSSFFKVTAPLDNKNIIWGYIK